MNIQTFFEGFGTQLALGTQAKASFVPNDTQYTIARLRFHYLCQDDKKSPLLRSFANKTSKKVESRNRLQLYTSVQSCVYKQQSRTQFGKIPLTKKSLKFKMIVMALLYSSLHRSRELLAMPEQSMLHCCVLFIWA